jgi:hypothetical protein
MSQSESQAKTVKYVYDPSAGALHELSKEFEPQIRVFLLTEKSL